MFELISKIIKAEKENRLNLTLRLKLFKFIKSLKYIFFDPANEYIRLHSPEYVTPSIEKEELDLVKRIFESYRKMKEDKEEVQESKGNTAPDTIQSDYFERLGITLSSITQDIRMRIN